MKIDGTRAHDRATEIVLAYYAACPVTGSALA